MNGRLLSVEGVSMKFGGLLAVDDRAFTWPNMKSLD